jgi:hypothetical protein
MIATFASSACYCIFYIFDYSILEVAQVTHVHCITVNTHPDKDYQETKISFLAHQSSEVEIVCPITQNRSTIFCQFSLSHLQSARLRIDLPKLQSANKQQTSPSYQNDKYKARGLANIAASFIVPLAVIILNIPIFIGLSLTSSTPLSYSAIKSIILCLPHFIQFALLI